MTTPIPPDRRAKVIAVSLNGATVRVEDLPLETVDRIAKQTDTSWFEVVTSPLADLVVAKLVVDAVATQIGHEPPTELTPRKIIGYFTTVPDDVPEAPKTEDDDLDDPFGPSGNVTSTAG